MLPQSQARKPRNSSRVNLVISLAFHGVLVFFVLYFAARGGLIGKTMQNMVVRMEKEKPVEKKKEPVKEPEPPKDLATPAVAPKMTVTAPAAAAPTTAAGPEVMAPPPAEAAPFELPEGRTVISADPVTLYKNLIETSVRARWKRPDDLADKDKDFEADVQVSVDASGRIGHPVMTKSSGNRQWDDAVKKAVAETADLGQDPPKNFPSTVIVRFDVAEESGSVLP
jgi:outer membrane biosynthesis protein TonB